MSPDEPGGGAMGPDEQPDAIRPASRPDAIRLDAPLEAQHLVDAPARRRIHEDLAGTFLVEAAAGTGKTTELIGRVLAAIRAGGRLERMVAVTFTDKAAGEMKLRLRGELERERAEAQAAGDHVVRGRLVAGLEALELAHIGTIHSFCSDLLRERPLEAGVDPDFEMLSEDDENRLVERAFDAWFQEALQDPPPGVRRVLHARRWGRTRGGESGPRRLLREAAHTLIRHRDFDAPWTARPFDREARVKALLDGMRELGALATACPDEGDYLRKSLEAFARFAREADARAASREARGKAAFGPELLDRLETELREFHRRAKWNGVKPWDWYGRGKRYGELLRADVKAQREALKESFARFVEDAEQELAAQLQLELSDVVERYAELKRRSGALDFLDLLRKARDLVVEHAAVRKELQARFERIFVDEFQDTDPLQAELLLLLAADEGGTNDWRQVRLEPGKLFVVGDPKQAIYRFRRADLGVYEDVKERVLAAGGEVLALETSFRAVPSLQRFLNAAFAPEMGEGEPGVQARYVALAEHRPEHGAGAGGAGAGGAESGGAESGGTESSGAESSAAESGGEPEASGAPAGGARPSVVALPIPEPYGSFGERPFAGAVEASCPEAVAAFVSWVVRESGWRKENGEKLTPKDFCFLFSRMWSGWGDVAHPYVRALEARGIAHVVHGGRSYHEREEVQALRQVLGAIEWPDDALAVYATLRGPFLAIADRALLAYAKDIGPLHPFAPTPEGLEGELGRVAEALRLLRELHARRNRRPIADTLSRFLDATRAHAGLAFWGSPRQTLANVARLVDRARRFDQRGTTSFRAFVDWLDAQADRAAGGDAPYVEEGVDGVRIMTVHKAKGLEFPVVVLCDPMAKESFGRPSRWVDGPRRLWATALGGALPAELSDHAEQVLEADVAERVRLLYVAATRARDLLVVPACGDGPIEGSWQRALGPMLFPPREKRQAPTAAAGCPAFEGDDTVFERPSRLEGQLLDGRLVPMRPGAHAVAEGVEVVWWDPKALELDVGPVPGLRRQGLLDRKGAGRPDGERYHQAWVEARERLLERAAAPTLPVRSVTEAALEGVPVGRGVSVARTGAWTEGRPTGARFGTLVHAVLADVPFDAEDEVVRGLAQTQGRLLGASAEEVEAAVEAVRGALGHPLLRRAAEATRCRRETPVHHRLEDGSVVEGVVDLAFEEADPFGEARWTVVDFKTDLGAGAPDEYVVQVELYAAAIEAATGTPADGVLLAV